MQGEPSSVIVTVVEPLGLKAAQLLNEDKTGVVCYVFMYICMYVCMYVCNGME